MSYIDYLNAKIEDLELINQILRETNTDMECRVAELENALKKTNIPSNNALYGIPYYLEDNDNLL